ncbi:ATP-binding protein [soil metagenome]
MQDLLHASYHRLIQALDVKTHRFLYPSFNLNSRLTGIIGPRGVGKTTLMLQYIKEHLYTEQQAFYFTADHIYFNQTTLLEFINQLYQQYNSLYIFIDEIHKYKNWAQELKNIYDTFPALHIIFSGSSSLDLIKGTYDLSRRATLYRLPGLSFREYLYLHTNYESSTIKLNELLTKPMQYNAELSRIPKILGYFKDYLHHGYYPFGLEDENTYHEKIIRIIEKTLYEDVTEHYNLKTENLLYLKKMLGFLAAIPPGEVNVHNIAKNLSIDFKTAFHYLTMLQETGLARMLYSPQGGNSILKKPEKIFLHNTSLLYALDQMRGIEPPLGNIRELFLLQSLQDAGFEGYYSNQGDLICEGRLLEVGGKNKSKAQLNKIIMPSILVKDDTTSAMSNSIPLHYFGFLY